MATTARVDFGGWENLHKRYRDASEAWPTELSSMLGEIGQIAKIEAIRIYTSEPNTDVGDKLPSIDSGKFGKNMRIARGGGKIRPWISIYSSAEYARYVELGGYLDVGRVTNRARPKTGEAGRKHYGQFADEIHAWAKRKFPGRGVKFADNTIEKIIREGVEGRRVLRRAISPTNSRWVNAFHFTISTRVSEFITMFLVKR